MSNDFTKAIVVSIIYFSAQSFSILGFSATVFSPTLISDQIADFVFKLSDDSQHIVYSATKSPRTIAELYSATVVGGNSVNLGFSNAGPIEFKNGFYGYKISPNSLYVVFTGIQQGSSRVELFRASIDGSSNLLKLNSALPANSDVVSFYISPDGNWVVYLVETDGVANNSIFSVPLNSLGTAVQFTGVVFPLLQQYSSFLLDKIVSFSPNSQWVIFGNGDVYSAGSDGSQGPNFLGSSYSDILGGTLTTEFSSTPDSSHVVFHKEKQIIDGLNQYFVYELHTIPIAGGDSEIVHTEIVDEDVSINEFEFVGNGDSIVFEASMGSLYINELYKTNIDGSTTETLISNSSPAGQAVTSEFRVSEDRSNVIFEEGTDPALFFPRSFYKYDVNTSDLIELNILPFDGIDSRLLHTLPSVRDDLIYISQNLIADDDEIFRYDLISNQLPIKLNRNVTTSERVQTLGFNPISRDLIYAVQNRTSFVYKELNFVPADTNDNFRIHKPIDVTGGFGEWVLSTNDGERVIYTFNDALDNNLKLYSAVRTEESDDICFPIQITQQTHSIVCF